MAKAAAKPKLSTLKRKEYFLFVDKNGKVGKKVMVYNGRVKGTGFSYSPFDDVNDEKFTKTDRKVNTSFTF